jgi:uncharacterized protein (DUF362 family)
MIENKEKYSIYLNNIDEDIKPTLQNGFEYIRWDRYIKKGTRIFVKPNFTFPCYVEGVTTNPQFLKSLLQILRSMADTVIVGESDGGNHSFTADEAFKGHGMHDICKNAGVQLVNLSTIPSRFVNSEILGKRVKIQLPNLLLDDIDCFISVPVFKIHVMTTVTLSLKNSWGCVPDTMRALYHQNLSYKLALIAKSLKPKIVVVDGTFSLNKHGPMYGEAVKTNMVLVSDNTVAADAMGTRLMGFEPRKIQHIAIAEKAGLGSTKLEDVVINQDWQKYRRQFQIRRTLIERASILPFNSSLVAKLIFQSPCRPFIYTVATKFRTSKEKEVADQISKHYSGSP